MGFNSAFEGLISSHPGLPEPSSWHNLKHSLKAMALKQLPFFKPFLI
jgi:hypothetical protein